jgi:hypothetical protein
MAYLSLRSRTVQPSLPATYSLASFRRIPLDICMRATRSPAVRIPPMPRGERVVTSIPLESPEPTYNPSQRSMSTQAFAARDAASSGG